MQCTKCQISSSRKQFWLEEFVLRIAANVPKDKRVEVAQSDVPAIEESAADAADVARDFRA